MSKHNKKDNEKVNDLAKFREESAGQHLTTNQGLRINDDQNSLKAGERGPSLLEDFLLREKITHFDHERIPERIVHARAQRRMVFFKFTNPWPLLRKRNFFRIPRSRRRYLYAFQRWSDRVVRRIWREMCAVSPLSFIRKMATTI